MECLKTFEISHSHDVTGHVLIDAKTECDAAAKWAKQVDLKGGSGREIIFVNDTANPIRAPEKIEVFTDCDYDGNGGGFFYYRAWGEYE